MKYRLFDFVLQSDIELPELERSVNGEPAMRIAREEDIERASPARWFRTIEGWHGERWVEIGRTDGAFVLKFTAGPVVRYRHREIRWRTPDEFDRSAFRHILLDQALPLIVSHERRTVLHAACVSARGAATLFLGPAGVGKSTLAALLARDGNVSAADDAVAVAVGPDGVVACAEYTGLRLWPDSCVAIGLAGGVDVSGNSEKRRFPGLGHDVESMLRAVYVLAPVAAGDGPPSIRPMSAREAVMALVRNSYVLDIEDRGRLSAHFDALARIARRVPVRKLVVPRRFDALDDVPALLARDLPVGTAA